MPTPSEKAKKCQTMTYMPNTIFSCQTTFKKAKFLEFDLKKNANLAALALKLLRSEIPSGIWWAKLRTVAASNNRVHMPWSLCYCLFAPHISYVWCCSSRTSRSWWITQSTQHYRKGCNNIPSFLQRTAPIARSLCEGWTPHDLHILGTAPLSILLRSEIPSGICAKLRTVAASNNRVHMPWSLYYCLFAPHLCMVLFFTHITFIVNHKINATPTERLQQNHH